MKYFIEVWELNEHTHDYLHMIAEFGPFYSREDVDEIYGDLLPTKCKADRDVIVRAEYPKNLSV